MPLDRIRRVGNACLIRWTELELAALPKLARRYGTTNAETAGPSSAQWYLADMPSGYGHESPSHLQHNSPRPNGSMPRQCNAPSTQHVRYHQQVASKEASHQGCLESDAEHSLGQEQWNTGVCEQLETSRRKEKGERLSIHKS